MVSVLDSESRGLGSRPGWVNVFCSWARHFTLPMPLYTQEYKWVLMNCQGSLMKCKGRAQTFFLTNDSTSDLPQHFKNVMEFCGMLEANLVGKNWKLVYIMAMIIYFSLHNSKYKTKNAWNKALQTGKKVINMYIWLRTRENIFLLFWQTKAVWLVWSLKRSFWIRNNLSWIKKILIKMNSNMIFCGKPKHI